MNGWSGAAAVQSAAVQWAAVPRMVAGEESRIERGAGKHRWAGWVQQIAMRVVIDEKRREEAVRRGYGVRARRRLAEVEMGCRLRMDDGEGTALEDVDAV